MELSNCLWPFMSLFFYHMMLSDLIECLLLTTLRRLTSKGLKWTLCHMGPHAHHTSYADAVHLVYVMMTCTHVLPNCCKITAW